MKYNFDQYIERRDSDSIKWQFYDSDVLPLWVADMDFVTAQPIIDALDTIDPARASQGAFSLPPQATAGEVEPQVVRVTGPRSWCVPDPALIEIRALLDEFQDWVDRNKNLNFTPILESADADWPGRSGYIYEVIEEDFEDLDGAQVYLCGSPQMVYGTIDKLKSSGLKEEDCYSDVFEFAPRDQKIAI